MGQNCFFVSDYEVLFCQNHERAVTQKQSKNEAKIRRLHVRNFNFLLKLLAFIKELISQRLAER